MSYTFSELIKQLPLSFKRVEKVKLMGKLCSKFTEKDEVPRKMIFALKYHRFLSRRKYNLLCKMQ